MLSKSIYHVNCGLSSYTNDCIKYLSFSLKLFVFSHFNLITNSDFKVGGRTGCKVSVTLLWSASDAILYRVAYSMFKFLKIHCTWIVWRGFPLSSSEWKIGLTLFVTSTKLVLWNFEEYGDVWVADDSLCCPTFAQKHIQIINRIWLKCQNFSSLIAYIPCSESHILFSVIYNTWILINQFVYCKLGYS